jgi:outer membrane protein OmpA-like peptidoglycan-associated protein
VHPMVAAIVGATIVAGPGFLGATSVAAQTSGVPTIPLVQGLRIDMAWHGDTVEGDYTPYFLVEGADAEAITAMGHAYKGARNGGMETVNIDTKMTRQSMRDGRIYRQIWITTDPLVMNNTTSMMLSSVVYGDIIKTGSAQLTIVDDIHVNGRASQALEMIASLARALTSDSIPTGTPYNGTVTRAEPGVTPFAVLINNRLVSLPTVHVVGTLTHDGEPYRTDLRVLADPNLPLIMAADSAPLVAGQRGRRGGRVVSITFPDTSVAHRMEQDLAARRPVEVYNIYFDFNSAAITPASDSALQMIGTILQRHADWHLQVTGHTDSIGGTGQGNRILSARRAEAVRQVLATKYGIGASRLTSGGAGDAQPLATNSTLEGRARNRRVELVRE